MPAFAENAPEMVTNGWSYHWGDIAKSDPTQNRTIGSTLWQFDATQWTKADQLETIDGRLNENILWLKLELPQSRWRDPYIFMASIDLTAQVFENNNITYQFGDIDQNGNSQFAGWPWHLIPVTSSEPTTLYFRVYSNYPFIGPSGDVLIGNHADLLDQIYGRGMAGLIFVIAVFIIGIVCACLGLIKRDRGGALSTGFLSFNLALMMFSENELSQVFYFDPLLWRYIAAFSYFLVPAFLAWVVYEWFKHNRSWLVKAVFISSVAFPVVVALLSAFTRFSFVNAYPVFDVLFIIMMLGLLIDCLRQIKKVGKQEGLITLGIFALFVSLLLDMLSAHDFIPWIGHTGQWGLIFFTLALLVVYLLKDRQQQKTLSILTNTLESQVAERTQELTSSQEKLERLAREDFLTGLLNRRAFMELANREIANSIRHQRPLSLILFDIDHFKEINDVHGHSTGDEVLKSIAESALSMCREGDLVCRYGGEEFVVLLHSTSKENARSLADRIQESIQNATIVSETGRNINVTASFGLISYTGYQATEELPDPNSVDELLHFLLMQADRAMYDVKNAGRNDIKVYNIG